MRIPPFDLDKPFYPLVINYVIYHLGMIEIMARSKMTVAWSSVAPALDRFAVEGPSLEIQFGPCLPVDRSQIGFPDTHGILAALEKVIQHEVPESWFLSYLNEPLWGSNRLVSTVEPDGIEFDTDYGILGFINAIGHSERDSLMTEIGSLLITAYQRTRRFTDHSPSWEFLRHCRNAAAHGGRFNFQHDEPRRPAGWRGLEVTRDMDGTPLCRDSEGVGLLCPGDPILLLWDLEQSTPAIV